MDPEDTGPPPPEGLNEAGQRLWTSIAGPYELDEHELALLLAAARTADTLDRLAEEAAGAPVTVTNSRGDQVPHPSLTESRQQSLTLARLLASLRVPTGDEGQQPQRRGGARGTYPSRRGELRSLGLSS